MKETKSKLTRREVLRLMALSSAGAFITACGGGTPETIIEQVEVEKIVEKVVTATPGSGPSFPGVDMTAIMRNSFIPEMNSVQTNQMAVWNQISGSTMELNFAREWREQIAAEIGAPTGTDIAELFGNSAFVYGDKLVDVSDICEELAAKYGGWYELARESAVVDGKWRAIPRAYTAQAINYRKDVFEEAGVTPPSTYDELLDVATKIFDAGLPPAGFTMNQAGPNDSANFAYSLLWSYGGAEVDEAGKVAIDSDGTRAALNYFLELSKVCASDITAYDEGGNNRAFLAGDISMTQNATSIYWASRSQAPDIHNNMAHFPYPAGPNGRQEFIQMNLMAIFESSDNVDAAKEWLRWMMQEQQLAPLAAVGVTFYTPLLRHYDDLPSMPWNIDPNLAPLKGTADGGHLPGWPGLPNRQSAEAYENQTIVNMFASVVNGDSVDAAITRAANELKAVYEA